MHKKFNILIPSINNKLLRLGRNADGGYVVDQELLGRSNYLLSFGLGDDWSFELDFLKHNKDSIIHIYDHTVNIYQFLKPFLKNFRRFITFRSKFTDFYNSYLKLKEYVKLLNLKQVFFYKKKVTSVINSKSQININKIFSRVKSNSKIIVKCDIEGDEYKIINEIIKYSNQIEMLIIEFHDLNKKEKKFLDIINKLKSNFLIIHIHGNNHCGQSSLGLPFVLEITFANKKNKDNFLKKNYSYPVKKLDFPNNPFKNDLKMVFKKN